MLIYLTLLIPILITFVFYMFKKHEFVWWEFFVPILVTLATIFITKAIFDTTSVRFTEYWGSTVVRVYESEPWNEWIHKTCSCCCDEDGNNCQKWDCSYQDDHGPRWYGETDIGETVSLTEKEYDRIAAEWNTGRKVTRTRRNHSSRSRASGSRGTKFEGKQVGRESHVWETKWSNVESTRVPYASKHGYENRIKASDLSVFNISVISDEEADSLGLLTYPKMSNGLYYPTIIGGPVSKDTQKKFQRLNAKYGPKNQVRLWILLYDNEPSSVGAYQENYWVKGNKNELVVAISLKQNELVWARSFSWALSESLTVKARDKAIEIGKFDEEGWNEYYAFLDKELKEFQRREFSEFSYIDIEPSKASIVTIIIVAVLTSLILNFVVTNNEIRE